VRHIEITMAATAAAPRCAEGVLDRGAEADVSAGLDELAGAAEHGLPWRLATLDELPWVPDDTGDHQGGRGAAAGREGRRAARARHPG